MSDSRAALIDHLLEFSIRTGDFTLKSGRRSTWFCDAKQTACRPEGILLIAEAALEAIPADATAIGGLTAAADPVAFGIAALAATRGRALRSFSIRKETKDHGIEGRLAGALEPGDRVVVCEDTVTRGTSPLDAARVASDIVLLGTDLSPLPGALRTARKTTRRIRENFRIATAYNVIAVPLAIAGLATPLIAALAMSTSSIVVSLNALRLR